MRGLGATTAQFWPSGPTVTELSLTWIGNRILSTKYVVGQSLTSLPVPVGWESIVPMYMLGQAKKAELDMEAGMKLEQEALKQAKEWLIGNRGVVSRVQVGGSLDVVSFAGTIAGGLIR